MKIICVAFNYPEHNQEMNDRLKFREPVIFMKSDVSLLMGGSSFYIPDFSSHIQYETEVVIRINRIGKTIARKFAYRYFDEISIGIDMTARDLQEYFRKKGFPWELCKSFDNSAIIGTFIRLQELQFKINQLPFHLNINDRTVQKGNTKEMLFTVDEIIAYVSRFMTLKMGDLIFTGTPPAGVGNVKINDRLQGYIGNQKLLDFCIK